VAEDADCVLCAPEGAVHGFKGLCRSGSVAQGVEQSFEVLDAIRGTAFEGRPDLVDVLANASDAFGDLVRRPPVRARHPRSPMTSIDSPTSKRGNAIVRWITMTREEGSCEVATNCW
jgi:hypothetical protein